MDKDDGGPAFPRAATPHQTSGVIHGPRDGMSLRDYFAGQALVGLSANPVWSDASWERTAEAAYEAADAMLEARKT